MSCPATDQLAAWRRGEVNGDLSRHLETCTACQERLANLPEALDPFEALLPHAGRQQPFSDAECLRAVSAAGGAGDPTPPTQPYLRRLKDYELLHLLGAPSGQGTVYLARHARHGYYCAVKLLRDDRRSAESLTRFRREIVLTGRLNHPNIVRFLDADEADGEHFLVMEYLEGLSGGQLLTRYSRLPVADACEIIRQAACAADHAYGMCKLIHRDHKPNNLILTPAGVIKVLDFGLARAEDVGALADLTQPGQGMGSPPYMSPEQFDSAKTVDIRSDLYNLGRTLYHFLAGQLPKPMHPVPPIRSVRPEVPSALAALLDRLLAIDPNDRPATPAELAADLVPFTTGCDLAGLLRAAQPVGAGVVPLTVPAPGGPSGILHASLDLRLWDASGQPRRSLADPGTLPLDTTARFQVEARLNRPAHLYLLWISSAGEVQTLYPWAPGTWDGEHPDTPRDGLQFPRPDAEGRYAPLQLEEGPGGVETVVLLARPTPLDDNLAALLPEHPERLFASTRYRPADPKRGIWFTHRAGEGVGGAAPEQRVKIDTAFHNDPVFQIHSFLRDQLGPRFALIQAVSFVHRG